MSQTDEIKSKIDIVDLLGEYIQLKQAGVNWRACCPFHNEKTPSFMVSREKQIWHCFGCGEGGDIFTFVQKYDGVDFPESMNILAEKAGVKLKKMDPQLVSQKAKIWEINSLAAEFYHQILLQSNLAETALKYLKERGLTNETISKFKIGFTPDSWDTVLKFLRKKGYTDNDIFLSGLTVKKDNHNYYDRFRGRIMFPIWDANSKVVGFTARLLNDNQDNAGGKYINTPQTLIYNKSFIIYGLDKAKKAIKEKDLTVVVEGQMDVIASFQAGVENVIASSGTAFTIEQLKQLQRYSNNLAVSFDKDDAGQTAADRGVVNALNLGMNIRVVQLPEVINGIKIKDPDDCIKQSVDAWKKSIDEAAPLMDYYLTKTINKFDISKPELKDQAVDYYLNILTKIPSTIIQNEYLKKFSLTLNIPENIIRESLKNYQNPEIKSQSPEIKKIEFKSREERLSEQLVSLITKFPKHIPYAIDHIKPERFVDNKVADLYKRIIIFYNEANKFEFHSFEKYLQDEDPSLVRLFSTLSLIADKDFLDYSLSDIEKEIIEIIKTIEKIALTKKFKQLQIQLAEAEQVADKEEVNRLLIKISQLNQEIKKYN